MSLIVKDTLGQSLNDDFNSAAYRIDNVEGFSICVKATETSATLAGTLKLQASNDAFIDRNGKSSFTENTSATWVDITSSDESVSGSGNFMWNVDGTFYTAVRLSWDNTTGEGTADIFFRAKGRSL